MLGTRRIAALVVGMVLGSAALAFASQPGGTVAQEPGVFRGYVDTRSMRGPIQFILRVNSYSNDDDLRAIETMLTERGQEAAFVTLAGLKPNGWLNFEHDLGYPVMVLGQQSTKSGRRIVALVNRPLGFGEMFWGARSVDYPFALVVLDVDNNGVGHGTFVPAARAELDRQGKIAFDDYLRIPYRIMRVRQDAIAGV